jgi:hypothetical protein
MGGVLPPATMLASTRHFERLRRLSDVVKEGQQLKSEVFWLVMEVFLKAGVDGEAASLRGKWAGTMCKDVASLTEVGGKRQTRICMYSTLEWMDASQKVSSASRREYGSNGLL